MNTFVQDERPAVHVEFFEDTKLNKKRSAEENRPIHDRVEKIRIRYVGDPKTVLVAPADSRSVRIDGDWPTYAERFPKHYEAFKEGRKYHGEGTPLAELGFLDIAKRRELAALNIHTAEDLASLDGKELKRLGMNGRTLKNQAQAYIDNARGGAEVSKLAAQNTELQDQLEMIKKEMAKLQAAQSGAPEDEGNGGIENSPFAEWDDESIRLWIKDNGGGEMHHKCGHETLVRKATEINDKLREAKAA